MALHAARRAVDAFRQGVGHAPTIVNDAEAWGGISVCDWKLPWLDGFELSENDDFVVAYHSDGSRRVRAACNGPWSDRTSTPGLVSVIPPDRRVEYTIDGEVSFSSIHVPKALLAGITESCFPVEPEFRFAFTDPFARSCVEILLAEAHRGGRSNFPYVHAITRAVVLHLAQAFRAEGQTSATDHQDSGLRLDAMLDFIDSRLAEPLRLEALAIHAGVSRAHFVRRFRQVTGLSPHRYITQRRIERAKELLRDSHWSVAQIALEVGFGNQSHFTQVFHAYTGQTPRDFQRGLTSGA